MTVAHELAEELEMFYIRRYAVGVLFEDRLVQLGGILDPLEVDGREEERAACVSPLFADERHGVYGAHIV